MINERPATPPNLSRLDWIKQHHHAAMQIFDELFSDAEIRLLKRDYEASNAAVLKSEWRQYMAWTFRTNSQIVEEIEASLHEANIIFSFGRFAKRVTQKGTNV